jgi:hypothetical protein
LRTFLAAFLARTALLVALLGSCWLGGWGWGWGSAARLNPQRRLGPLHRNREPVPLGTLRNLPLAAGSFLFVIERYVDGSAVR